MILINCLIQKIIKEFTGICSQEAIDYTVKLLEDAIVEVLEMVCNQHMAIDSPKCVALFQSDAVFVSEETERQSISFFLPLIELYTGIGSLPGEN